jgi:hypothetical protein
VIGVGMWRFVKAIFISWLIGVICGGGLVLVLQHFRQRQSARLARTLDSPYGGRCLGHAALLYVTSLLDDDAWQHRRVRVRA